VERTEAYEQHAFVIARLTFREAVRRRIVTAALLLAARS